MYKITFIYLRIICNEAMIKLNIMITLNYTLNGFNYKQDFDTINEAYSELVKINTEEKFVLVIEKDSNWNYEITADGKVRYVATEYAQSIGCKSGYWGCVERLQRNLKR